MRAVVHTDQCDFYQIDGAVNPGSSGGPALNYDGAVVAVIAMKATDRGETELKRSWPNGGLRPEALGDAVQQTPSQDKTATAGTTE